jgi:hypothetical protein
LDRAHAQGTGNNLGTSFSLSNWPSHFWLLSFLNALFLCVTSGVPMTWWKLSGQFVHQSSWSTTRYNEPFLLSGTKLPFSAFGAVTKSLVIR